MSELKGVGGELRATVTITRAATGKVETFELIGHTDPETHEHVMAAIAKNREHGASGGLVGQIGGISMVQPVPVEIQIES